MEAFPEDTLLKEAVREAKTKNEPARRRRFQRQSVTSETAKASTKPFALTPVKLRALRLLAECRVLSLPQLSLLLEGEELRPKSAREKSARRHLRELFDAGLVSLAPISRASLAGEDAPNDASLLYGSAPNIYLPSAEGIKVLVETGVLSKSFLRRSLPAYGPKNSLHIAHELMARDMRVYLERLRYRHPGSAVLSWQDGQEAAISLSSSREVRPDAWFVLQVREETVGAKATCLVGLVEADRGTERGRLRWREKVESYADLFLADEGQALQETTGYRNARVIVTTPDAIRRDNLAVMIAEECATLGCPTLAERFWLAVTEKLIGATLHTLVWRTVGCTELVAMLRS